MELEASRKYKRSKKKKKKTRKTKDNVKRKRTTNN